MKRLLLLVFILSLFAVFLAGCGQENSGLPDHVIAEVNGEQISAEGFDREFKDVILEPGKEAQGSNLGELREIYLDQIIERKILVQEAKRQGITISPEEMNQAISEIQLDYPKEGFGEKLTLKGMTLEGWKDRLEEKLLAEKVMRSVFHSAEKVEEKDALRYYESHRSSFQMPQKVRARQIVVADGEEAIQILKRLKRGESFEALAKEKSLGPEKTQGGDLGYFSTGEKPAEFDQVFNMEVGALSEVIKSPYGYHIFKLEEKASPRQIPFSEARLKILQQLTQKKGEECYQKWLEDLKERAHIKINKKLLKL